MMNTAAAYFTNTPGEALSSIAQAFRFLVTRDKASIRKSRFNVSSYRRRLPVVYSRCGQQCCYRLINGVYVRPQHLIAALTIIAGGNSRAIARD